MKLSVTLQKALLGGLTFLAATLAANPDLVTNLIPANVKDLTIGGLVAAAIVGLTNWIKNRTKTS